MNGDFTVTAQFNELVTGFDDTDITISNGSKGIFTVVDGDTYTLIVTPTVEGIVTADVAGAAAIDSTGNDSIVATQLSVMFDGTAPIVTLLGPGAETIAHGSVYTELGATWTDAVDGSGTLTIASSGSVDTMTLGVYTLEYIYTDVASNTGNIVTRTVTVSDQTAPVLSLVGSGIQTVEQGSVYTELGATWTDAVDGSGILSIASSGTVDASLTGTYILEYTYTDAASNIGNTVTRTVIVADTIAPVVTLMGLPTVVLLYGDTYVESGATWTDTVDGSGTLTVANSGFVDTMTLGTYILEYTYTDVASNISSMMTRTVIVTDGVSPVVTLSGALSLTIAHGSVYTDPGALWTDDVDGSGVVLSASSGSVNTALVGVYTLEYSHIDTSSNTGNTVTRTVTVTDQAAPVVTLVGLGSQVVNQGTLYTDLGATWTDAVDGSGMVAIASSGTVDTAFTGTYILEYTHTDAASNTGNIVTRIVTVIVEPIVVPTLSASTGGGGGGGSSYSSPVVMAPVALMSSGTMTTITPIKIKTIRKVFKPRTLSESTLSVS